MTKASTVKESRFSHDYIKELVTYCPESGVFRWNKGRPGASAGNVCGTVKNSGYRILTIRRVNYRAHRVAWFYMTGHWPTHEIDHINSNRDDNRFCNLREATKTQNSFNKSIRSDNQTGYKNVLFYPAIRAYYVRIVASKVKHEFGPFTNAEAANDCAVEKRKELHGKFHHQ